MSAISEDKRCPVCKCPEVAHAISKSFEALESSWAKCHGCGSLFTSPLPSAEETHAYYCREYKMRKSPGAVSHAFRFGEENKKTILEEYRLSLNDVGVTESLLRNRKILDYGCANGFFLDYCSAIACGKEMLFGFDIAEDLMAEVKQKGYLGLSDEGDFDFIFMWDVLEHIPDPVDLVSNLRGRLKKGGRLILQTPRFGLIAESLGEEWEHLLPLEHVVLYTREALIGLFTGLGFSFVAASSFGANAPPQAVPQPYKRCFDRLAKQSDNGSTQVAHFEWKGESR